MVTLENSKVEFVLPVLNADLMKKFNASVFNDELIDNEYITEVKKETLFLSVLHMLNGLVEVEYVAEESSVVKYSGDRAVYLTKRNKEYTIVLGKDLTNPFNPKYVLGYNGTEFQAKDIGLLEFFSNSEVFTAYSLDNPYGLPHYQSFGNYVAKHKSPTVSTKEFLNEFDAGYENKKVAKNILLDLLVYNPLFIDTNELIANIVYDEDAKKFILDKEYVGEDVHLQFLSKVCEKLGSSHIYQLIHFLNIVRDMDMCEVSEHYINKVYEDYAKQMSLAIGR